jgi:mono/diheme cytochrome c family protein
MTESEPKLLSHAGEPRRSERPGATSPAASPRCVASLGRRALFTIVLATLVSTSYASHAQSAKEARLQRGAYLVERAIGCAHCHTPRDEQGRRLPGRDLSGAMMQYKPIKPSPKWAPWAPAIAGLPPGYSEAEMTTFMETGIKPNGQRPRAPMPPFQLHRDDAEAIAAYLASMKTRSP